MSDKLDAKAMAQKKMEFLQYEYWKAQNGKQDFIRCPYCKPFRKTWHSNLRLNKIGDETMCCPTFARALKAILDRQEQIDIAAKSAKDTIRLENMMAKQQERHFVN